ncbi:hypothetical protein T484DRAFT_2027764 [Baffinella frigidus]|nr:hypothetical protein T484DRAFT_2027764 [Cryptophyta sp. CCMP2293]
MAKHYLDCKFEEKEKLKELGGKWDADVKKWYCDTMNDSLKEYRENAVAVVEPRVYSSEDMHALCIDFKGCYAAAGVIFVQNIELRSENARLKAQLLASVPLETHNQLQETHNQLQETHNQLRARHEAAIIQENKEKRLLDTRTAPILFERLKTATQNKFKGQGASHSRGLWKKTAWVVFAENLPAGSSAHRLGEIYEERLEVGGASKFRTCIERTDALFRVRHPECLTSLVA